MYLHQSKEWFGSVAVLQLGRTRIHHHPRQLKIHLPHHKRNFGRMQVVVHVIESNHPCHNIPDRESESSGPGPRQNPDTKQCLDAEVCEESAALRKSSEHNLERLL